MNQDPSLRITEAWLRYILMWQWHINVNSHLISEEWKWKSPARAVDGDGIGGNPFISSEDWKARAVDGGVGGRKTAPDDEIEFNRFKSCVELCAVHCVLWAVWSWVLCFVVSCLASHAGSFSVQNCNRSGNCNATDIFGGTTCTLFVFFLTHFGNKFQQHTEEHIGEEERNKGANSNGKLNLTQLPCVALSWSPCSLYFPFDHIWMGTITNWKWSLHTRHVWFFKNQDPL